MKTLDAFLFITSIMIGIFYGYFLMPRKYCIFIDIFSKNKFFWSLTDVWPPKRNGKLRTITYISSHPKKMSLKLVIKFIFSCRYRNTNNLIS